MKKNDLLKFDDTIIRVLDVQEETTLIIDCMKRTMPKWITTATLSDYVGCSELELLNNTGMVLLEMEMLDAEGRRFVYEHFTLIAGILPFVGDKKLRNHLIQTIAEEKNVSKRTIGNYLCLYLVYQNISAFAPKPKPEDKPLSKDEKNMRWALNKYFYNQKKNSLPTAYTMMLKERYCDVAGVLLPEYPSIHQFRYFEKRYRKQQNFYISRNGLKDYQKNHRPLLGDGVQEFAPNIGKGMLDATVCDIYLVDDSGNLVGRPILTACIDAYSGLCCGYSLSWEGGTYSLRGLLLNVISDKVEHCKDFGINIKKSDWDCDRLPATLVTDMGSEYISYNFEQIAELGVTLINLPAYRPELKGTVEKFFDLVQSYYKPHLKGKGVIEPDFQERGSHDYRKDACLTLRQFEIILIRCIIFYNTKRVLDNFPYSSDMIQANTQPYCKDIWNYGCKQLGADLISITKEQLILTLFPRTQGKFTRQGLKANGLRYKHDNYTERFLKGGNVTVTYNPEDVSCVWLLENGNYIRFVLIESRFKGKNLLEVQMIQNGKKNIVKGVEEENLQAQIELVNHIEAIVSTAASSKNTSIKGIRNNRQKERNKTHVDYMKGGVKNA